ncbi:hypothetical protein [Mesoterricola silvestris]|uniref:Uncharacterized protein n=1 Tax=Mesoterricola silvestris TaxID=2927979 RepID=A0AA48H234_9BACT|nr:hypothetical protein [Mesoterricola silvestris]BDU74593.1 hypothetical protein METEAL_37670 [Mesoterricola silvestris]
MIAAWLFLYLGGLVHGLAIYGLDFQGPRFWVLVLPVALLPVPVLLKRHRPRLFDAVPIRPLALAGLAAALLFMRGLNLDHWSTPDLVPSALVALMGAASLWVALKDPMREDGALIWLRIGLWQLTGFLHPVMPLAGASVFAFLGAFGQLHPVPFRPCRAPSPRAFPAALALGLVLAKPWWDYAANPGWAPDLAAWGLGAGLTYLLPLQRLGCRVPMKALYGALALLFVAYLPQWGWAWGLLLGLTWGWTWQRLERPLPFRRLSYGLLLGFVLSFALHANLQIPVLRHVLWLGN